MIGHAPMVLRIQIAKFKFHQYLLRANLPNLMLAKLSHYTVYASIPIYSRLAIRVLNYCNPIQNVKCLNDVAHTAALVSHNVL